MDEHFFVIKFGLFHNETETIDFLLKLICIQFSSLICVYILKLPTPLFE